MTDTRVRDTIDFFDILCRRSARPYRLVMGALGESKGCKSSVQECLASTTGIRCGRSLLNGRIPTLS